MYSGVLPVTKILLCYARVVLEAGSALTTSGWLGTVNLWRPAGMLQCFPIFSMALACQTNIFEVRTVKEITVSRGVPRILPGGMHIFG